MTRYSAVTLLALLFAIFLPIAVSAEDGRDHGEATDGHDGREENVDEVDHDDEDHDDGLGDDHADHAEDGFIELSSEAMKLAGIVLARAERGRIGRSVDLPGEVGFNEDRLVHVAPRFAGVAKEAHCYVGDYVEVGDVIAVIESNESLTQYAIKATISGWVIERHITPGEFVTEEHTIYVIADLSSVWVNLAVHPRDVKHIAAGQPVALKAVGSDTRAEGTIDYVSPVLDIRTRSVTARVVLPNRNNAWRPGTFVQAQFRTELGEECLVVKREAVQILDDEHVVFVTEDEGFFRSIPVVVGDSDTEYTRILSGLTEGAEYVAGGAFELKAKVVTSSMGEHAGHGH